MGYRSEIAIRIEVPSCTTAEELLERINKDYTILEELFDEIVVAKEGVIEVIKLHASYVKWYHHYTDISMFEQFLEDFEEEIEQREEDDDKTDFNNHNGAYHYIRIGEEYGDIEERCRGDLCDYMGICRYIEWEN